MENKNTHLETFMVKLPSKFLNYIEDLAYRKGVTMSWIIRVIMKNPKNLKITKKIQRPRKFEEPHSRFPLCFYGDKYYWKTRAYNRGWEFAPWLRNLIELYVEGDYLEDLNYEDVKTIKHRKSLKAISEKTKEKSDRYVSKYQSTGNLYCEKGFHPINRAANRALMLFGLANRKNPRLAFAAGI